MGNYYPCFPEITGFAITTYFHDPDYYKQFHKQHNGIDLAYQNKHYKGSKDILAIADGVVTYVCDPSDSTSLKWVNIMSYDVYADSWLLSRYFHFSKITCKIGDKVKRGDKIGVEGKTGKATGSHLELQTWIVPVNYVFNIKDEEKYVVNPLNVCYLAEGQECVYDPRGEVKPAPAVDYKKLYEQTLAELETARADLAKADETLETLRGAIKYLIEEADKI